MEQLNTVLSFTVISNLTFIEKTQSRARLSISIPHLLKMELSIIHKMWTL